MRKLLDVSRMAMLGWRARLPLSEGLPEVVAAYQDGLQAEHQRSTLT
jgi:hypothetical protein